MKDASDLRAKAKGRRRERRNADKSYKDLDRVNFKSSKDYKRHEQIELEEESDVEMQAWKLGQKRP